MKALTLHQPWAWAIAHAGKPVENRTWKPPRGVIGQRIAIHAGKRLDKAAVSDIEDLLMGENPGAFVQGAVVATARLDGYVHQGPGGRSLWGVSVERACEALESRWFVGPFGWVLEEVVALAEPVPARGAQGLWTLPADVAAAVERQEADRG